jgi:hypothetical protein
MKEIKKQYKKPSKKVAYSEYLEIWNGKYVIRKGL